MNILHPVVGAVGVLGGTTDSGPWCHITNILYPVVGAVGVLLNVLSCFTPE